MELEELKAAFARQQRALDASLQLNAQMLATGNAGVVRRSLNRFTAGLWVEIIVNGLAVLCLGSFTADNIQYAQFALPALLLWLFAGIFTAGQIAQIVAARTLNFDQPVSLLQERIAALRVWRVASVRWTLLCAPAMWVPFLVVVLRAGGVDAYALLGVRYLAVSLAVCIAVTVAAVIGARMIAARSRGTTQRRIADWIAGSQLTQAIDSLEAIRRFNEEPQP